MAESDRPECTLANILSGIMYRFRVTALTPEGQASDPSEPSDPFVINLPGKMSNFQKLKISRSLGCERM